MGSCHDVCLSYTSITDIIRFALFQRPRRYRNSEYIGARETISNNLYDDINDISMFNYCILCRKNILIRKGFVEKNYGSNSFNRIVKTRKYIIPQEMWNTMNRCVELIINWNVQEQNKVNVHHV